MQRLFQERLSYISFEGIRIPSQNFIPMFPVRKAFDLLCLTCNMKTSLLTSKLLTVNE